MKDTLELGRVTDRRPPFKYSALNRVWFSDTDAQGVVYYGRYLPYFDHARTEYHRHLGDVGLVEAFVRVRRIGRTSVTYECAAYRLPDETLMAQASQTLVLVGGDHRPTPIPSAFRETVRSFEGEDLEA
ncbi:MAG: hypothetical protein E6G20_02585 [Actinobacteria bacterium]|nr:MAG: hypothetical protein E6G20_02585 [Actinomycetota bacterium]